MFCSPPWPFLFFRFRIFLLRQTTKKISFNNRRGEDRSVQLVVNSCGGIRWALCRGRSNRPRCSSIGRPSRKGVNHAPTPRRDRCRVRLIRISSEQNLSWRACRVARHRPAPQDRFAATGRSAFRVGIVTTPIEIAALLRPRTPQPILYALSQLPSSRTSLYMPATRPRMTAGAKNHTHCQRDGAWRATY